MEQENERPHLVRMFPDHAGTVLWFDGPVRYCDSGLTDALAADLRTWEQSYYDSLDWGRRSPQTSRAHATADSCLAHRVAAELGDRFEVEFDSPEDGGRARATAPASNPAAAAAFTAIARGQREREERIARSRAEQGDGSGWYACSPLSGAVYRPKKRRRRRRGVPDLLRRALRPRRR